MSLGGAATVPFSERFFKVKKNLIFELIIFNLNRQNKIWGKYNFILDRLSIL